MVLGFDFYGSENNVSFATSSALNNFNRIDVSNVVVDELMINTDENRTFIPEKESWSYTTVMDALFNGDLSAGSVNNGGIPIQQIKLRKRKANSLEWADISLFEFNKDISIYSCIDRIIASNEDYEYSLVPITQGIVGNSLLGQIHTSFDGTWIANIENSYQLLADLEYSDIEHINPRTLIETYSKYPVMLISPVDYKKSTLKCKVLTNNVLENSSIEQSDIKPLKQLKDNMLKFFKSRKPFILKSANGDYLLVGLMNFKETPNNELKGMMSGIQFDWAELGNTEIIKDLQNAGLIL